MLQFIFYFEKSYIGMYNMSQLNSSQNENFANDLQCCRICIHKLLIHKKILKRCESFTANVSRCNFSIKNGWSPIVGGQGKTYVDEHGLDEYKPADLRGVDILDLFHIKLTDYVILTEEQYKDYKTIIKET